MKFTKVAIVLVFLLSFSACANTAYLSTVRENEKEKRLELQNIRIQLEERISDLEDEKLVLQRDLASLKEELKETQDSLQQMQAVNQQLRDSIDNKDKLIETKGHEIDDMQRAIRISQDRNRELESTMDQLERALEQMKRTHLETTGQFMAPQVAMPLQAPQNFERSSELPENPEPPVKEPIKEEILQEAPQQEIPEVKESGVTPTIPTTVESSAVLMDHIEVPKKKSLFRTLLSPFSAKQDQIGVEPEAKNLPEQEPHVVVEAKSVELPIETEKKDTQAGAAVSESLQAGRVLLVNRKFNFVVINVGLKQGIRSGDLFLVLESGQKVAKVEIEKLYDDFSAAKIVEHFGDRSLLKEGNLVTRM